MRSVIAVIAAAAVLATLWLPRADAAEPPDAASTSLSDAEIERRLDFIEQRLDASKRRAQIWYWSWLTVNGAATVPSRSPRPSPMTPTSGPRTSRRRRSRRSGSPIWP
jgi:hypothetical protein